MEDFNTANVRYRIDGRCPTPAAVVIEELCEAFRHHAVMIATKSDTGPKNP
jgi:hypothetical protein